MAFSPQFLDELRNRTVLVDVVSKRVRLTHKGREHQGLCPFHKEKTPSFTVNEDKGFYHCFGCGAHGSAIDFVMNTDGLSFPEAVERLAGEVGLDVPVDTPQERERAKHRQTLYDVMEAATVFYEQKLRMPEGRAALDYLHGRGLDDATISAFRLGFAPDGRATIQPALRRQDISDEQMIDAGLLISPDDAARPPYDRFRDRVMFPIGDRRDRIIAFGGRIMGNEDKGAKYLNSPETPLFHKGNVLYNLHRAQGPARDAGTLIVTEGYMDVIGLYRAGFANAVAPLGTALTEDQIALLWKITPEPVLCFDGDNAGQRAATRAVERALPLLVPGHGLRFAHLPPGEDPDSLVSRQGPEAMTAVIERAEPLSEVLWRMETGERLPKSPEQRAAVQKALEDHTRRIADGTVRSHFQKEFRDRLWAAGRSQGAQKKGKQGTWAPTLRLDPATASTARLDPHALQERILLATLIGHPGLYDAVEERLGTVAFSAPGLDILRQEVLKTLAGHTALDSDGVRTHLIDTGFAEILGAIWDPRVFGHAFFARPEKDIEIAREGWEETYALYKNMDLRVEIQEERERSKENMSPENVDRLNSLTVQKNEAARGVDDDR